MTAFSLDSYDTILFDFDGTLVDSNGFKEESIVSSIHHFCTDSELANSACSYFCSHHGLPRRTKLLKFFDIKTVDLILGHYSFKCSCYFSEVKIDSYLCNAISLLHQRGKSLYILSGGSYSEIHVCLCNNGLRDFFVDILADNRTKYDHLSLLPLSNSFLLVGDSKYDYQCSVSYKLAFASILLSQCNEISLHASQSTPPAFSDIVLLSPLSFYNYASI